MRQPNSDRARPGPARSRPDSFAAHGHRALPDRLHPARRLPAGRPGEGAPRPAAGRVHGPLGGRRRRWFAEDLRALRPRLGQAGRRAVELHAEQLHGGAAGIHLDGADLAGAARRPARGHHDRASVGAPRGRAGVPPPLPGLENHKMI